MKIVSFVIPVYRNQGSLRLICEQIMQLFKNKLPSFDYEIVFVDDGSDDNSPKELVELHSSNKKVKVITFSRNFGQLAAITAGLNNIAGDCAVVMSADLQDPIEIVEEMVKSWVAGSEIVIGCRVGREDALIAKLTSKIFYSLVRTIYPQIPRNGFDFCLMDKVCVAEMNKILDKNRFFQGDVLTLGFSVQFIPYKRLKRTIGKSQWTAAKKIKYFIDCLATSSYVPLRFMSIIGFATALAGFFYGLLIFYERFRNNTPFAGWAPIMILILVIGGLIMSMLGIIGEYIWRIYDEVKKRPNYIIKNKYFS
jgi:polyisoprenyl-phosphate glycosyltransferase